MRLQWILDRTSHSEAYRADLPHNGVDYDRDGSVVNAAPPPPSGFGGLAKQTRGTVDQLFAYIFSGAPLAYRGTCALVVSVFDGSGLYNLRFGSARASLRRDGQPPYPGELT
jgi:hypothetical protein